MREPSLDPRLALHPPLAPTMPRACTSSALAAHIFVIVPVASNKSGRAATTSGQVSTEAGVGSANAGSSLPRLGRFRPTTGHNLVRSTRFCGNLDCGKATCIAVASTELGMASTNVGPCSTCNSRDCQAVRMRGGATETTVMGVSCMRCRTTTKIHFVKDPPNNEGRVDGTLLVRISAGVTEKSEERDAGWI